MSNHDDDLPDEYFEPRIAKTPIPKDAAAERKRLMEKLRQAHSDEAEIERLRGIILRATAELECVEYDNDPPQRVVRLLEEMRAVNRGALLTPNA